MKRKLSESSKKKYESIIKKIDLETAKELVQNEDLNAVREALHSNANDRIIKSYLNVIKRFVEEAEAEQPRNRQIRSIVNQTWSEELQRERQINENLRIQIQQEREELEREREEFERIKRERELLENEIKQIKEERERIKKQQLEFKKIKEEKELLEELEEEPINVKEYESASLSAEDIEDIQALEEIPIDLDKKESNSETEIIVAISDKEIGKNKVKHIDIEPYSIKTFEKQLDNELDSQHVKVQVKLWFKDKNGLEFSTFKSYNVKDYASAEDLWKIIELDCDSELEKYNFASVFGISGYLIK